MNKKTRTLLITVISFAVVITIAAVAYNALKDNAPAVSFTPILATAAQAAEPKKVEAVVPSAIPVISADQLPTAPVIEDLPPTSATGAPGAAPTQEVPNTDAQAEEEKAPVIPNLPLTRLDGTMTSFNDVRDGKPAVINYFASWCPPCKQELPHFQKAFDEYGDQVSFIFLDALDGQRETLKTINAFIKDFPFTGPVFYDNGEFAMTFQTSSLPTTVFIDKDGRVVKGYLGFVAEEVLYRDIAELLN